MDLNLQAIGQTFAIYAIPVLFAITLHEVAHGYVARHFGDMTAHAQGRISLNPMRHVDLLGTVVVPLIILVVSAGKLLFGWAKPVPVNYSALRKPRPHMAWVAAAGPIANLAMALLWAVALRASIAASARSAEWLEVAQFYGTNDSNVPQSTVSGQNLVSTATGGTISVKCFDSNSQIQVTYPVLIATAEGTVTGFTGSASARAAAARPSVPDRAH